MKAFLDTSVLVATFYADHEHHRPSIDLFLRFQKDDVCCAAHSLAEVYAVLTGMPAPRRVSGNEALLFLGDILQVVEAAGESGLGGGAIYDAVLGHCALKANAEVIYTWNAKDFLRLPPVIAGRVLKPEE